MIRHSRCLTLALALVWACCGGCTGPDRTEVSGEVTLDNQPLESGLIRFVPIDGKSQPADAPIVNGQYSATMPPGEKRVEISAPKVVGKFKMIDSPESPWVDKVEERLPARYNTASETKWTAEPGKQTKNFAVSSK